MGIFTVLCVEVERNLHYLFSSEIIMTHIKTVSIWLNIIPGEKMHIFSTLLNQMGTQNDGRSLRKMGRSSSEIVVVASGQMIKMVWHFWQFVENQFYQFVVPNPSTQ